MKKSSDLSAIADLMIRQVNINTAMNDVLHELDRACAKYPPMKSAHEAYAVILEEIEEFWDETRKRDDKRDLVAMREELIQIAAMAMRAIEDLQLYEKRGVKA